MMLLKASSKERHPGIIVLLDLLQLLVLRIGDNCYPFTSGEAVSTRVNERGCILQVFCSAHSMLSMFM